jgi:helicase
MMNRDAYLLGLEANVRRLVDDSGYRNEQYQVRSKDLLSRLSPDEVRSIDYEYRIERLTRNASFLFDAAARLLSADRSVDDLSTGLRQAAEVFEHLFSLGEGPPPGTSALLSAGLYQLAGYQANSICLAQSCELPALPEGLAPGTFTAAVERWANLALQRKFVQLLSEVRLLASRLPRAREAFGASVDASDLRSDILVANIEVDLLVDLFYRLMGYVLRGADQQLAPMRDSFERLYEILGRTGQANESMVIRVLDASIRRMVQNSTWHWLSGQVQTDPLWQRYAMLLARGSSGNQLDARGVVEFWRSQQLALEGGLLDATNHGFVIRMPTSAGKTRIAELAIIDVVDASRDSFKVVYVAPYRALSDEVERSLSGLLSDLGFAVSTVLGSFEMDEIDDYLLQQTDLLITTPEKLNLLSRARPEFFKSVRLLILDEGHVIDDTDRGAQYELLLTRLKRLMPDDSRVLFISAVMPETNARQFAAWLCDSRDAVLASDWRPSRQLLGLFTWTGDFGRLDYPAEAAGPGRRVPFVPRVIRKTTYLDYTPKLRKKRSVSFPGTAKGETAAELAIRFADFGPVLIFAPRRDWVESCAKAVQRGLRLRAQTDPHLLPSAFLGSESRYVETAAFETTASWLGKDSLIAQLLRSGIAVHHAGLPEIVRRGIEDDFRSGTFPILVSTNTLGQGVNLPIKTVIVHSVSRYRPSEDGSGGTLEYVSQRDFWNICGRAGRAGFETEGQIIFLGLNRDDINDFSRYASRRYEVLNGRMYEMLKDLVSERISQQEFSKHIDSEILAIMVEESVGESIESRIEEILGTSLVSIQAADDDVPIDKLVDYSKQTALSIAEEIPDDGLKRIFAETGLRVSSCQHIAEHIQANREQVYMILSSEQIGLEDLINEIFEVIKPLPQMQTQYPFEADHLALLMDWINEMSISDLVITYTTSEAEVQKLSQFIEDYFVFRLPWGMNGYLRIAQHLLELDNLAADRRFLSSMVKYGVGNPLSTWPMALGCPSRELAAALTAGFLSDQDQLPSLARFIDWFSDLSEEDLAYRYGASSYQARVLTRRVRSMVPERRKFVDTVRTAPEQLSALVVGMNYEGRRAHALLLQPHDVVELRREYTNGYDRNAVAVNFRGNQIGFLDRRIARLVAPEMDCGRTFDAVVQSVSFGPSLGATIELVGTWSDVAGVS